MKIDVPQGQAPLEGSEVLPAEELLPLVYQELRKLAAYKMAQETPGHTPRWSTKPGCGSGPIASRRGPIAAISLRRRPKPCAGFWWNAHGATLL
jgi:hypothetical protein